MEEQVKELSTKLTALSEYVHSSNQRISGVLDKIIGHLLKIEQDVTKLQGRVELLDKATSTNFGNVQAGLEEIKSEISKINDVTGYEGIFSNKGMLGGKA